MVDKEINIGPIKVRGIEIPLPGAPLVVAFHDKGFVMCGYLNAAVADKFGTSAGMVRGVNTVEDLLKAPIQEVNEGGKSKGVAPGMSGQEALLKFHQSPAA